MQSLQQSLSSQTQTPPILLTTGLATTGLRSGIFVPLYPTVLVSLSSGASLTYNVEVTGDGAPVSPNGGNWVVLANGSALTGNSLFTLYGAVIAVRANITAYSSGTLIIQVVTP